MVYRECVAMVVALGVGIFGAEALAQQSEGLLARANALRHEGRNAEALEIFQRMYRDGAQPSTLARMALTEGALGRWVDAESHLAMALSYSTDSFISQNRATLDTALTQMRSRLGTLQVTGASGGEDVLIDGRRVGRADGSPLRVVAGTVRYEVRVAGRAGVSRTVTVEPGAVVRESVGALPDVATTAAEGPRDGAASRGLVVAVNPASPRRAIGIASMAVGGAAIIGGVVSLVVAHNASEAYNTDPQCPGTDSPSQPAECASRMSDSETFQTVGWVSLGLGATAGIVGAILFATSPSTRRERAGLTCGAATVGWGLRCAVTF